MPFGLGFFAVAGASVAGAYDLLETQVLSGSQSSVTFSNLNSTYGTTYKHLQIRYVVRSDRSAADGTDAMITFINGDTGNNYNSHILSGDGSNVGSAFETYQGAMDFTAVAANTASANAFAAGVMDFLDAFETTKFKTRRTFGAVPPGATSYRPIYLTSNLWRNTAAISSITLDQRYGSNFLTGSRFSLYGIKGA